MNSLVGVILILILSKFMFGHVSKNKTVIENINIHIWLWFEGSFKKFFFFFRDVFFSFVTFS